ncbi:MAG: acetyl-CoA decarbonylase/synthase complex subunit delta, partial [Anaerolineales bacterium]|nr:acetyl-CoA decarbonylase/synthase complex subunit delta [Anaerolineales bacterium]
PGVMGVGKYYLVSPKFISADGGFKRIVWISKVIKETMADELQHVAEREGIPDLIDRIADGDKVSTVEQLQDWVQEMQHPVLEMGSMVREPADLPQRDDEVMAQATAVVEEAMAKELTTEVAAEKEEVVIEEKQAIEEVAASAVQPESTKPETAKPVMSKPVEPEATTEIIERTEKKVVAAPPQPPLATHHLPLSQAELLQQAQEAALRQAQALQQAAADAVRQAELLGKVREMAATPTSPTEAVDALRNALQAALGALGGTPLSASAAPAVKEKPLPPTPEPPQIVKEVPVAKVPEPTTKAEPPQVSENGKQLADHRPPVTDRRLPITDKPWLTADTKTPLAKEKWSGKVREITLGATKEQGGTRTKTVTIGGETAMPFMDFEGVMPHAPVIAVEIKDTKPEDWSPLLLETWGDAAADPARWAVAAEQAGADLIQLTLGLESSIDTAVSTVKSVLQATGLPLIVAGPGQAEKDNELLVPIADVCKGERLALGICEDKNYRTIVAGAMANDHLVIARTAMDVNLAKQLNILISDMGLPLDRVIMDPTTGALGYGFEYGYSVMERLRLAALQGDGMTQLPMMVTPGEECWKTKESKVGDGLPTAWGDWRERAITWETVTAVMLIESGANIVTL